MKVYIPHSQHIPDDKIYRLVITIGNNLYIMKGLVVKYWMITDAISLLSNSLFPNLPIQWRQIIFAVDIESIRSAITDKAHIRI